MRSEEWEKSKLGSVCIKIGSGATPRGGKETYLTIGPYAFIRSQNILDFNFSYEGLAFINEKQAGQLSNVELMGRDVLLNITGDSVARVCQVPTELLPARVNQHVSILRPDITKLIPEYLKYYLLNPIVKEYMLAIASVGGTRNALTKSMIEDLEIVLPPLRIQQKIADILSAFDEKIEINRQMNATLEAMAQAIFKEWFVDFNFQGATGEMVESELGMIPKGWRMGKLEEMFDFLEGPGIRNWQYTNEGVRFINIRLIENNDVDIAKANFVSENEAYTKYSHFLLKPKDMIVSTSGTLGKTAIIRECHLPLMLNTSVIRFRPIDGYLYPFMYQYLQSDSFNNELLALAAGSVQLNFGPSHLKRIKMVMPPENLLVEFARLTMDLYYLIGINLDEINVLSNLRDWMLPKLMKGDIKV